MLTVKPALRSLTETEGHILLQQPPWTSSYHFCDLIKLCFQFLSAKLENTTHGCFTMEYNSNSDVPDVSHLVGHCLTMRSQRTVVSPAKGSASSMGTSFMSSMPQMMSGGRPAVSPHMATVRKWVSSPARKGNKQKSVQG